VEGLAASVVAIAILLGVVFLVGFMVVCLVRLAAADDVRFLPKWAWAVVVVCVNPLGGVAYLLSQLPRRGVPEPS
jgi:ABC-2 type transport system ATP-binding protein